MSGEKRAGLCWHGHDDILVEWCHDYEERARGIRCYRRCYKPADEIDLHLLLFQSVKGKLPEEVVKAYKVCDEARRARYEAMDARYEAVYAHEMNYDEATALGCAVNEALYAYVEMWRTHEKVFIENREVIEALHREECPNCPWDGETIFPRQK